jgi:hypothetical protein
VSAVFGALVGSIITAVVLFYQSWSERNRTRKAIAIALLWEIDDFYRGNVQKTFRALERASPSDLGYYVRTPHKGFTIYEASADRIGLFRQETVKGLVVFYTSARAYLNFVDDYGQAMAGITAGEVGLRPRAITLLDYVKRTNSQMIPLIKLVTELLATEAGSRYDFEPPERI